MSLRQRARAALVASFRGSRCRVKARLRAAARRWAPRWAKDAFWISVEKYVATTTLAKTGAKEWVRLAYHAHFSASRQRGISGAWYFAEEKVAGAGMRYMDHRYRQIIGRMLRHARVPLLGASEFRPGAVLFATGSLGPGGSERQAVTTLLGMVAAGHADLALVCQHLNGGSYGFYRHLLDRTPVRCSELPTAEELRGLHRSGGLGNAEIHHTLRDFLGPLPLELRDVERFALELTERRPEVLHAWLDEINIKAGLAAAIIGVPRIVLSTRSVAPPNFLLFQPYMREAYRALARLDNVCLLNNSEAGARSYENWLRVESGRFTVVPNGLDLSRLPGPVAREHARREYRARYGIGDSCLVLGSVTRFYEEKRPHLWLQTAARIAQTAPDTIFLMIGDGPLLESVRERVRLLGLGPRFVLPGRDKNAIEAMAAMDVFLLTSRVEGLPNVLLEAQAMGLPVVTTDVGGAREALLQGQTGYAVSPPTPGVLADAVAGILQDPALRAAVSTRGPAFVRKKFDLQRMVHDTVAAYDRQGRLRNGR